MALPPSPAVRIGPGKSNFLGAYADGGSGKVQPLCHGVNAGVENEMRGSVGICPGKFEFKGHFQTDPGEGCREGMQGSCPLSDLPLLRQNQISGRYGEGATSVSVGISDRKSDFCERAREDRGGGVCEIHRSRESLLVLFPPLLYLYPSCAASS